ncbi:C-type lectin 1-like [Anneissia japonica]|uniref:C-type lectin 1-like n=1 Tax=Anneissia japonica TaxID=1529436 RepID=UPI0014255D91|nr:C-type lectin 1-like [Anneissia japonica]
MAKYVGYNRWNTYFIHLLFFYINLFLADGQPFGSACGSRANAYYEEHCYYVGRSKTDWYKAKTACIESRASDIIVISNQNENDKLLHYGWYGRYTGNTTEVWIGYRYNTSSEMWEWDSGSGNSTFENWKDGEPTLTNGHCAALDAETGLWSARSCNESIRYVCENHYLYLLENKVEVDVEVES